MGTLLDKNERKKIDGERRCQRDHRIWRRLTALLWLDDGLSVGAVAARLDVSTKQVRRWLKIFREEGLKALTQLELHGRPCELDDNQIEELKEEIVTGRFHTATQIIEWVERRFRVRYSQSGIKDLLKRIGVSYHKVSGFFWKADPIAQEEWLDEYRCDPVGPTIKRYFVDACHPIWGFEMLFYCWLLVGQRFHVKVGSGRKRLNILGAYCPEDHDYVDLRLHKKDDNINGKRFVELLKKIQAKHPTVKTFILYLDNAKYYSSPEVAAFLKEHPQFILKFLPPYSPNLNLIERLWKFLRKEAFCRNYDSFEDMQRGVADVLDHLEKYHAQLDTLMTEDFHIFHPEDHPECCACAPV